jgi:hypothetical protein
MRTTEADPRLGFSRWTAFQEIWLSVGFAASLGRCHVKGILAGRISWEYPSEHSLLEQPQDRSAIFDNDPQPRRLPQHREIDSAKTKTREENIDAIAHMLIVQRGNCLSQCFRAVGLSPAVVHLGMCFFYRHLQRCVRHGERNEIQPVPRAGEPSGSLQALV